MANSNVVFWVESGHSAYGNADLHSRHRVVSLFPKRIEFESVCFRHESGEGLSRRLRGSSFAIAFNFV